MVQFQLCNVTPSNWLFPCPGTQVYLVGCWERSWFFNHANIVVLLVVWYAKRWGKKLGKWHCPQPLHARDGVTSLLTTAIVSTPACSLHWWLQEEITGIDQDSNGLMSQGDTYWLNILLGVQFRQICWMKTSHYVSDICSHSVKILVFSPSW
jgi:hypothetical protein